MKKMIFSFCLLCMAASLSAQQRTSPMSDLELGQYYLSKSKSQKTIGWILLGGGLALYIGGIATYSDLYDDQDTEAGIMVLTGSIATIASIPLFITAAKNKGRAEILLRNQNIPLGFKSSKGLSVGIGIPIGK